MRIAIIGSKGIPPTFGGFETFVYEIAKRLDKKGNLSVVVYGETKEDHIIRDEFKGIRRVSIPRKRKVDLFSSRLTAIHDAVEVERVDAIYLLGYSSAPFINKNYLRNSGVKLILNPDGMEWRRSKYNALLRFYFKLSERYGILKADFIVSDSKVIKEYILKRYGKESTFIPYGFNDLKVAESEHRFEILMKELNINKFSYCLVIGRCVPENNFSMILEGFKMSSIGKKLLLVSNFSSDTHSKEVKKIAASDSRIILSDPIYDSSKIFLLRKYALCYIHGHSVGGTNPSLVESMGAGNIIVAHHNPFNIEVVGEELGYFFSSSFELKGILEELDSSNPIYLDKKRALIKERAYSCYNWDKIAEMYAESFYSLKVNH